MDTKVGASLIVCGSTARREYHARRRQLRPPPRQQRRRRARRSTAYASVTARPQPSTSPSARAAVARERSPAGHGSWASSAGPTRMLIVDRPVPAASCHASTDATGDVSTAAISSTEARKPAGCHGVDGNARQPRAWPVGDRLEDPGLVGDEHLRDELALRPPREAAGELREVDAGVRERAARELHRPPPPQADARIDQPARDQWRPVATLVHRGHEGVILVTKVGVELRPERRACRRMPAGFGPIRGCRAGR